MVSNTGDGIDRPAVTRLARAEHSGQAALVVSVIAIVCAALPATREFAWLAAVPAVVVALIALNSGLGRKRYATVALTLGWFAFSYSFALMLWG